MSTAFKKTIYALLVVTVIAVVFAGVMPFGVSAQESGYTPLAPLPFVTDGGKVDTEDIGGYVKGIFQLAVAAAGILAVLMLTIGGFQYMTSGGGASSKEEAKERIKSAVFGFIIVISSVLVLNTINPNLLNISLEAPVVNPIVIIVPTSAAKIVQEASSPPTDEQKKDAGGEILGDVLDMKKLSGTLDEVKNPDGSKLDGSDWVKTNEAASKEFKRQCTENLGGSVVGVGPTIGFVPDYFCAPEDRSTGIIPDFIFTDCITQNISYSSYACVKG